MRGGTSKGLFFNAADLPPPGTERDRLLLRVMGSPDPLQIDGMGGTTSSTSKIVVANVGPGGSVEYAFGQVAIDRAHIDWSGNCGNLTTAVAPFALYAGLATVSKDAHAAQILLRNINTGVLVETVFPVVAGVLAPNGDFSIAGVPGSAAPITTNYLAPAGSVLNGLLPLGATKSVFETSRGPIVGSLVDATNPYLFVSRQDVPGADRSAHELAKDRDFLDFLEEIRAAAAVAAGVADNAKEAAAKAPTVPRLVLISDPPRSESARAGSSRADLGTAGLGTAGLTDTNLVSADIDTVTLSMGQIHRGIPMTAALALAAARTVPGSFVAELAGQHHCRKTLETTIRHPLGATTVSASVDDAGVLRSVGVTRTARLLMRGEVFV